MGLDISNKKVKMEATPSEGLCVCVCDAARRASYVQPTTPFDAHAPSKLA